ncbi:MAG: citrate synthase [Dehalococcoidia bacterium]|nr:citrate synthase [Dehalococcoidia bacterium]HCV00996.1 citrate synthase [Dehalococcoidia bacterium]|tara:strand:+ start:979 stop:2118 length:1140 start_codon:yes stop_codon:yes gene_type:complete
MTTTEIQRGLEGVNVADTKLCTIDGQKGQLIYAGYDIYDLAEHASFEEVAFLLWNLRLPTLEELSNLQALLINERPLSDLNRSLITDLAGTAKPMRALEICIAALGALDPKSNDFSAEQLKWTAARLTARMPTVVAAFHRQRLGLDVIPPRDDLGHAANFLWCLKGDEPSELEARVFDVAMTLHAEHEMNASTFSAIVTASTMSDMYSAIASAIGTLKGPLHGGANSAVFEMLEVIGDESNIESHIEAMLARGERVMGIGHRVYKTTDPRAIILEKLGEELAENSSERRYFDLSRKVRDHLGERLSGRPLYPNVDFFSASVYHMLGIPHDLYTPIFAVARIAGWSAHLLEQYADNRLVRPNAVYSGEKHRLYEPIEARS